MSADITIPKAYKLKKETSTSAEKIVARILDALFEGQLRPGQKIVASRLAEDLDVSIVPVREALHILAGEGVVELQPLKGARIKTMSREEAVQWWDIYRAISNIGIKSAALIMSQNPGARRQVLDAMDHIRRSARVVPHSHFLMTLADFHRTLGDLVDNELINEASRRLQVIFWCLFLPDFVDFDKYIDIYVRNYQRVADSILLGDAKSAMSQFDYHVAWSTELIRGVELNPHEPWPFSG